LSIYCQVVLKVADFETDRFAASVDARIDGDHDGMDTRRG
jgi:hypothetical protein